ncbi:MAG: hypothetical protein LBQ73_02320 [Tannerellaceae bacterium]|jgi:hypothetical protein|nr:hypothetical protein [Tannerellaceae bacterium]
MKRKLFEVTLICISLIPVCRAQSLDMDGSSRERIEKDRIIGEWIFEKAEILVKQKDSPAYVLENRISNLGDMQAFALCFGLGVENIRFSPYEADLKCLSHYISQAAYELLHTSDSQTLLEIVWYPFIDGEPDTQQPLIHLYWISMPDADTLIVSHDVYCARRMEDMKESKMLTYLKRL